jgi:hypothetical protein
MTKPPMVTLNRGFVNVNGKRKVQVTKMNNQDKQQYSINISSVIPDGNGGFMPCPELLTEAELIRLLRVPEVSKAKDHRSVIANLKRMHDLPRLHLCGRTLYPTKEIEKWISEKCISGK